MTETGLVACVDFGSTFTKAALVEVPSGRLVATASAPTTLRTDLLDGWEACRHHLSAVEPGAEDAEVIACSSAAGGLRIAVVGNEELVTAEAGRRVALSSGGRVVHVADGALDDAAVAALGSRAPTPADAVRRVGRGDGGNEAALLGAAHRLAQARWRGPVVVAGNVDVRDRVAATLDGAGTPYVVTDNVVPRIGVLAPEPARRAIRQMFLEQVIGGKHLSSADTFAAMVRSATPDAVLTAVELLARGLSPDRPGAGEVVVVDVGGATTDVYSVTEPEEEPDAQRSAIRREVVPAAPVNRTVEADLGTRWSAVSTVEEAVAAGFVESGETAEALEGAARRQADPGYLPADSPDRRPAEEGERDLDRRLAGWAAGVAIRRHAGRAVVRFDPSGRRLVERSGTDLRQVRLLVGSGGVIRHTADPTGLLLGSLGGEGGWQVPDQPRVIVDHDYVLAAAGLLSEDHPEAAYELLTALRGAASGGLREAPLGATLAR